MALSYLIGSIWETFIFAEFRKALANTGSSATLWYYRDAQGREVDFLLCSNGTIDLFECKWTESPDHRWLDRINEVARYLSNNESNVIGRKTLLCTTPMRITRQDVECVHGSEYFL